MRTEDHLAHAKPSCILTVVCSVTTIEDDFYAWLQLADFAATHPMNRVGDPDEVVKAVLFLASNDSAFTTGDSISVDGGVIAI